MSEPDNTPVSDVPVDSLLDVPFQDCPATLPGEACPPVSDKLPDRPCERQSGTGAYTGVSWSFDCDEGLWASEAPDEWLGSLQWLTDWHALPLESDVDCAGDPPGASL